MENWTWEKLKGEVDKAHRRFFEKRGICPSSLNKEFIFGVKPSPQKGHTSQSSERRSDRPK